MKERETPNLKAWCERYQEETTVRVATVNVPLHFVVDELMGQHDALKKYVDNILGIYNSLNDRVTLIEERLNVQADALSVHNDSIQALNKMLRDFVITMSEGQEPEKAKPKAKAKAKKTKGEK
jgi:hypothetical protein